MPEVASINEKYTKLKHILGDLQHVAVAFSAGVDSTLLLKLALDTLGPDHVLAVTAHSDSLAAAELDQARRLADMLGAEHVVIETNELDNPAYRANPVNRCYFCKTTLYEHMAELIQRRAIRVIVNGMNSDDLSDYRPGIKAAGEYKVRSPLAEAGLTKSEVRALSKRLGLPTFDKPASPCLSSRVQYGEAITPEKLKRIEQAEAFLKEQMGIRRCRVRHHDNLARIEVPAEFIALVAQRDNAARIAERFRELGYIYITLDLMGFRSGSLNEVIAFGDVQPRLVTQP